MADMEYEFNEVLKTGVEVYGFAKQNKTCPNLITIAGQKQNRAEYLRLAIYAILQCATGDKSNIKIDRMEVVNPTAKQNIREGDWTKAEYINHIRPHLEGYMNINRENPELDTISLGTMNLNKAVIVYSYILYLYVQNKGKLPDTVDITTTNYPTDGSGGSTVNTSGVYVETSWKDYDQTTDYTCGPSSSVMALSALGIDTTESEMSNREWTTSNNGTGHDGMIAGCIAEAKEHGITLTVTEQNFSDTGYQKLGELIADPKVAVIANGMCSGWPTYYKTYKGGHYVFPVKVDMNTSKVYIADPARSYTLEYSFKEFQAGLAAHSLPSLLILRKQ